MDLKAHTRKQRIKEIATELGFISCGISKAEFLEEEARYLEAWLSDQKHGEMGYMANHFDKRVDPRLLVDGAKSVISLTLNYFPKRELKFDGFKISKYAYGEDYHLVIKDKLFAFMQQIQHEIGEVGGRVFVDSAPVMDKAWAKKSGLGWIGKHTNLITPQKGSFFFIAELIIDMELEPDGPIKDYCGTCTKCIDACPTNALTPYEIDARRCISYLTIELKDRMMPSEFTGKMDGWTFGCDICQDVCPWNRFAQPTQEARFDALELMDLSTSDWNSLDDEQFKALAKKSPIFRTRLEGMKRNLDFLQS